MIYPEESMLYAPVEWRDCSEGYTDIRYHKSADGIAKITINRPQVRNAFRPVTVKEMIQGAVRCPLRRQHRGDHS